MKIVNTLMPKICHATPGDVVQLLNDSAEVLPEVYMVCVFSPKNYNPRVQGSPMNGLYSEERPLFLVNIETGVAIKMPHLSERVLILAEAQVLLPGKA